MFITFEGPDGVGKTTLSIMLAHTIGAVPTSAAKGTEFAKSIYDKYIAKDASLDPIVQQHLFLAMHRQHLVEVVKPAISRGAHVVCDRYLDSFFAYGDMGIHGWQDLYRPIEPVEPDITFLLWRENVEVDTTNEDKFDAMSKADRERIHGRFLILQDIFPDRIKLINTDQSPANAIDDILDYLS